MIAVETAGWTSAYLPGMRYIVLLRGINLGPRNRIAMSALRELLASAGFDDVATYLQSGNIVFSSDADSARLAAECERLIAQTFGLSIDILVRTRDELAHVVARNPLGEVAVDPKRYQVTFLQDEIQPQAVEALAALAVGDEQLLAIGRELYAWHPDGIARSQLAAGLAGRGLGVKATARNWTTTTKLLAMADE
jgi:uncharacterized protein (DUF1697 family)